MDKVELGKKLFIEDKYHCSQAVIGVFKELIDEKEALKISSCFGGGMRCGEMCGAVVGALMALGLIYGYYDKDDETNKDKSNKLTALFVNNFKEKFNGYLCKEIKGSRIECGEYVAYAISEVERMKKEY